MEPVLVFPVPLMKTGQKTAQQGFTLVELMIVILILSLLCVIAWPNFVRSRSSAQVKSCINNLKQIDGAKMRWAFDNRKTELDVPVLTDLVPYMQHDMTPTCPGDGTYRPRRVARQPTCTLYSDGHALSNLNADDDPAVD